VRSWDDEEYAADHLLRYFSDKLYELGKAFGSLQHENANLKSRVRSLEAENAEAVVNILSEKDFHAKLEEIA
jgi:hypothetical protein